jgi:type VI secretion system secreted protein VgrG
MSNLFDDARRFVSDLTGVSGRQAYFFEVPGTESAVALSVVSVMAVERMGYPTEVRWCSRIRCSWPALTT